MWGFGICRSVTLKEMGDILAHANVIPEHRIVRALNFDGGSSTALYLRLDGRDDLLRGKVRRQQLPGRATKTLDMGFVTTRKIRQGIAPNF